MESASGTHESLLISAPPKLYSERTRQWGAFLPMYSAHSDRSWGAGNFTDFRQVCEWLGNAGGKVMGTLPLLSAFLAPTGQALAYGRAGRSADYAYGRAAETPGGYGKQREALQPRPCS